MPQETQGSEIGFVLECIECLEHSDLGRGWKAFVAEDAEVVVYCEDCAEREFGD